MADKHQTQCPHCGVKFQISDQQLAVAGGKVRCGSCLQVFQASQHLVPLASTSGSAPSARGTASARPGARPATPVTPTKPADAPVTRGGTQVSDNAATQVRPAITIPPPAGDEDLADMILRELEKPVPPPPPRAAPPPAPPADDDLADMILRELESAPASPPPPSGRQPPAKAAPENPQWSLPEKAAPRTEAPTPPPNRFGIEDNKIRIPIRTGKDDTINPELLDDGPEDRFGDSRTDNSVLENVDDIFGGGASTLLDKIDEPADESWAKEILGEKVEDEREARVRKFTQFTADNMSLATTGVQKRARPDGSSGLHPDDGLDVDDLDFLNDDKMSMRNVDLPGIKPGEDYDTVGMAHEVIWSGNMFWGALSAVFLLVLLGQYMFFNFDTLSRDENWRGVYEVTCEAIGCELPGESDITRIQGANLIVRSHPRVQGALIVDAIVFNRAPFPQPFPDLELTFSDRSGTVVAGRVFKPAEYLKGELSGSEVMTPDTPIHLSLELLDPGTAAVNYELRFLAPATSS